MTYRDDHTAAIDRLDALEVELARAEAERDRLAAELELARGSSSFEAVPALTPAELDEIVTKLDVAARAASQRAQSRFTSVTVGTTTAAIVLFVLGGAIVAATAAIAGIVALYTVGRARARTEPARWLPVITSVRQTPERVTELRRLAIGSRQALAIRTSDHELVVRGNRRGIDRLLELLERRCPNARMALPPGRGNRPA